MATARSGGSPRRGRRNPDGPPSADPGSRPNVPCARRDDGRRAFPIRARQSRPRATRSASTAAPSVLPLRVSPSKDIQPWSKPSVMRGMNSGSRAPSSRSSASEERRACVWPWAKSLHVVMIATSKGCVCGVTYLLAACAGDGQRSADQTGEPAPSAEICGSFGMKSVFRRPSVALQHRGPARSDESRDSSWPGSHDFEHPFCRTDRS